MLQLAGMDLTGYFPVPFTTACPGLVTDTGLALQRNFTAIDDYAIHWSGAQQTQGSTALLDSNWYPNTFLPYMQQYTKGEFVIDPKTITDSANDGSKSVLLVHFRCFLPPPRLTMSLACSLLQDVGRLQGRSVRSDRLHVDCDVLQV